LGVTVSVIDVPTVPYAGSAVMLPLGVDAIVTEYSLAGSVSNCAVRVTLPLRVKKYGLPLPVMGVVLYFKLPVTYL